MVYLNGAYVPRGEAKVDVEDRGFLFADGVYEVVWVHDGVPMWLDEHIERLWRSAAAIELELPFDRRGAREIHTGLIARHPEAVADATIYLQVTRGAAPRTHAFPADPKPTVFAQLRAFTPDPSLTRDGVAVITLPDERWLRPEVKSVSLLPNVLASERARRAGAYEAVLVRDGVVTEASHSNFAAVIDGVAVTHPESPLILSGITRGVVLAAAARDGIPTAERAFTAQELAAAEEAFLTGTSGGVVPVVRLDGRPVGDGRPGRVTLALAEAFGRSVEAELAKGRAAMGR